MAAGGELPADAGYDLRLIMAVDAAMYEAGELQELLDDTRVENIDINGCDEVWVTYADDRGKVRGAADRRHGRRPDPDRAEPRRVRAHERPAVHPGEPGAGPAVAGRVPAVGGDGARRNGRWCRSAATGTRRCSWPPW